MKERPMLMSAPMVRAILAGTNTQTRRVVKPQPFDRSWSRHDHQIGYTTDDEGIDLYAYSKSSGGEWHVRCPYGKPGDRLWVREAWRAHIEHDDVAPRDIPVGSCLLFDADKDRHKFPWAGKGRPSIHMPRWASRILLEIVGVRVERLQDISEADAIAEGVSPDMGLRWKSGDDTPRGMYGELWESINGPGSWAANPWVWVVEFKRVTP